MKWGFCILCMVAEMTNVKCTDEESKHGQNSCEKIWQICKGFWSCQVEGEEKIMSK